MLKTDFRLTLILALAVIAVTAVWFVDPIPQDLSYHLFADRRAIFGIPNFLDVISNAAFVVAGLVGIYCLRRSPKVDLVKELVPLYYLFFTGVMLVGIGSAWYHLAPDNQTLVWDRLPMTLAFMTFFTILIGEMISLVAARRLFLLLVASGAYSVYYWQVTEQAGQGDLRFYIVVQFLPMILIPAMLLMYRSRRDSHVWIWMVLLMYLIAKMFEYFDKSIYNMGGFLSGHTLKHLVSALGCYFFLRALLNSRRGDSG